MIDCAILTSGYHNKHLSIQAQMVEDSLYYLDTSITICSVAYYCQECCEIWTSFESSIQALQLNKINLQNLAHEDDMVEHTQ